VDLSVTDLLQVMRLGYRHPSDLLEQLWMRVDPVSYQQQQCDGGQVPGEVVKVLQRHREVDEVFREAAHLLRPVLRQGTAAEIGQAKQLLETYVDGHDTLDNTEKKALRRKVEDHTTRRFGVFKEYHSLLTYLHLPFMTRDQMARMLYHKKGCGQRSSPLLQGT
jgi:hypothetical protein